MIENVLPLTLFGAPVGMWTGKIRSYLRKQGVPYVERFPSDPVFEREVIPAVKRFINPVIRLPDGTLVQDTADIIDHFETTENIRFSVYPRDPIAAHCRDGTGSFWGRGPCSRGDALPLELSRTERIFLAS
jgi:hypothetical protein